ncbi:uncharacterized protein LOC112564791 [Pomacea canaliculata]|uniref:uncharacterized protein LOC112564791 n=1 Tax=Pomacea canaliculata TaxID=400727 RepID=UPI000D72AD76|nr:uncharacterized protein LOC112564791 [Pomacea canaliculata]
MHLRVLCLEFVILTLKNFALNAPCSQCANYSNWTPDKAVDGNSQSCSQTDVWSKVYYSRHIHWWRVDLGKLILVSYIVITNTMDNCCSDRLANFTVELGSLESNGSITYTVCRYHDGVAGPLTSLNCTRSIWGQFVRISLTGVALTLCEVEVMATRTTVAQDISQQCRSSRPTSPVTTLVL